MSGRDQLQREMSLGPRGNNCQWQLYVNGHCCGKWEITGSCRFHVCWLCLCSMLEKLQLSRSLSRIWTVTCSFILSGTVSHQSFYSNLSSVFTIWQHNLFLHNNRKHTDVAYFKFFPIFKCILCIWSHLWDFGCGDWLHVKCISCLNRCAKQVHEHVTASPLSCSNVCLSVSETLVIDPCTIQVIWHLIEYLSYNGELIW